MKKTYQEPQISIDIFENTEVVTTSGYIFMEEGYGDDIYW